MDFGDELMVAFSCMPGEALKMDLSEAVDQLSGLAGSLWVLSRPSYDRGIA
jgi:hypothetical protein